MSEESTAARLLAAGGFLPTGTTDAGEEAVPFTARAYRHPALADRVVVRLTAADTGEAEDAAAAFLGLEPDAAPEIVGLGRRTSLGFPEWVLVHHPEDGHHALAVVPEMERAARLAANKPKAALEAYVDLGGRLAVSVPHLLPTFYERAGRDFLAVENPTYAAQLFTRARKSETEHGIPLDEDRLDEVFLEFALAGAVPVKTLSAYAKELSARLPADEALHRFVRLCVRRTSGGLPPSAQMGTDLRRLARAAGGDAADAEREYVARMLELPATSAAGMGWWKAHRAAIVELAAARPEIRAQLLDMAPSAQDGGMPELWLEVLEESGATALLCDPAQEAPKDGAVGWLRRFVNAPSSRWRRANRLPALEELVTRMSGRLRAELAAKGAALEVPENADLLDVLLALGLPVEDPAPRRRLALSAWGRAAERRDLAAVGADPRFRQAFLGGFDNVNGNDEEVFRALAASPGARPLLGEWVRGLAARARGTGLPHLHGALDQIARLPGETLALAADAVGDASMVDLAEVLATTLRGGLLDELHWPAFEAAVNELSRPDQAHDLTIVEEWPYLVVADSARALVLDGDGVVLDHALRVPAADTGDVGFRYVDGVLLVHWETRGNRGTHGYWHTEPDRVFSLTGADVQATTLNWHRGDEPVSLPVPGGGRTTGAGILHVGDTALPENRDVIGDGTSFWVRRSTDEDGEAWHEYDPRSGALGRRQPPAFLTPRLADGEIVSEGWLMPFPAEGTTAIGELVGGVLGKRVIRSADGSQWRAEDLAGNVSAGVHHGVPGLLFLPGDPRPRTIARQPWSVELFDPEGRAVATAKTDHLPGVFGRGTVILPPWRYWAHLRPRDNRGSAALRRIDRETAAALLKAAHTAPDGLADAVRALLPSVTHDALVTGLTGVITHAAGQQNIINATVERLTNALSGGPEDAFEGPADQLVHTALSGIDGQRWWGVENTPGLAQTVDLISRLVAGEQEPAPRGTLHLAGVAAPYTRLSFTALLGARAGALLRAVSWSSDPAHRDVLGALLAELDRARLLAEGLDRWRRVYLRLDGPAVRLADGTNRPGNREALLALDGGAVLVVLNSNYDPDGADFEGFYHDPSGAFEIPAPYRVRRIEEATVPWSAGPPVAYLAEYVARGPAPWFPEAAAEFARRTGVTPTLAALVVAGMPGLAARERGFLSAEVRKALGVKVADADLARDQLTKLDLQVRQELLAALLPADPADLWLKGPDAVAAAAVWNRAVGARIAVSEALLGEAGKAVRLGWEATAALRGVLEPATEPRLTRDLEWKVERDNFVPVGDGDGFTAQVFTTSVAMTAWLAHRLPAGDPLRARLPEALRTVRERLAHPGLMLRFDRYFDVTAFRKAAGAPTEEGEGWVRYGAIVLATYDTMPYPAIKAALLDAAGEDPYLPALRSSAGTPFPVEIALRAVKDPRFDALLADPGDPVAGERGPDGTWWPQDPTRSVPELVTAVVERHGLGADAAAVYLMLLAMPDPTDRNTARWTGWKPARLKAARAELAESGLVLEARRTRAGRSLFLPGAWAEARMPRIPMEQWKHALYDLSSDGSSPLTLTVPSEPVADVYRRAWKRITEGDEPRFADLEVRRTGRRR
ncbi:DNA-binding protein [Actinocorallia sp. API 0066]|uniref:DNA-binding protein n=1 Tax=Actinocorallia sp. API 0066 TaxID=2896846 RepID=UPI001E43A8DA|nr:DNA-binding protein [Actinocorallia sp. API 0066]MCD0451531.1 DNA-binding protein [Actinocorallia sp. API 0066]